MPQPGMPQPGMPQPGMQQPGMPQNAIPQNGIPQSISPNLPMASLPQPPHSIQNHHAYAHYTFTGQPPLSASMSHSIGPPYNSLPNSVSPPPAQFIQPPYFMQTIPGGLPNQIHNMNPNGMPTLNTSPSVMPGPVPGHLNQYPSSIIDKPQMSKPPPEIQLEIMAKGLRNRDIGSESDPTCVVFLEDHGQKQHNFTIGYDMVDVDNDDVTPSGSGTTPGHPSIRWREVGRTECLKDNLNPHFKVQVTVPYVFEQLQHIRFGLWDIDSRQTNLDSHDFLGDARTTVGELVMSSTWTSALSSPNIKDTTNFIGRKRDLGKITVIVHENRDGGNIMIKTHLTGKKLDRKDFGISSDPYFIVTQVGGQAQNSRSQLYESEVIKRTVNPTWKPFHIKVAKPKGGNNSDVKIEFLVNDKDKHSRDDEIGKAVLTLEQLEKSNEVQLIMEKRRVAWGKRTRVSGIIKFSNTRIIPMPSLVDYLQGGLKLHFSVAVDLTASNGNPNEPLSLHYFQDLHYQGNQYTRALTAIANVLHVYTPPDQFFSAFGFGAILPGAPGYTNSCFNLSLGPSPVCRGLQGILEAYVTALKTVKLSGPTNFAPLIDTVAKTATQRLQTQTDQNYDILLILTDGVVSDFELTVDQIISASHKAPLSIIIVGIGNRNFDKMRELDSDGRLLTSSDGTRQAARDICQFVAFKDHEGQAPDRLGAYVLAEVPGNIVEYFAGICNPPINPGRPIPYV